MLPNPQLPSAGEESLLRLLFEQAPGFIAVLEGPSHVFALVNPAYQRLVGPRDLIGKSVSAAIPEARAYGFLEILDEVYTTGKTFVGRRSAIELIRSAGAPAEKRFVDFLYQPLLDSANSVAGIFVEGHDVTEEVEAESMLREEVAQRATQARIFDTVLSSIDDYAYTFDREGRFTYSNKPLLDLLGLTLDEVVGKTFPELPYPPELAARLHADIAQVVKTGLQVKGETYYMSPTGKEGWYEYVFNPVMANGSVSTVAGSTRNLTQHREQERRLAALNDSERAARAEGERASRLKDDFLATLSHELRTPLNSIQAWAHLLRSGRLTAEQSRDAVERIARNAHAQGQLIADLLDMNSIVSGKIALKIERIPLARPLQGAIDAVSLEAAKKSVAVQVPALDPTLVVDCDPDRLQQVFWNLLANAVKFTPSEGTITIRAERNATSVRIDVSDTGIGIANDFLPHLFERFSQADSSATRTHGGLGLGLSICKSLVEMHGGRISVESGATRSGTTFSVSLPLKQEGTDQGAESTWGELAETEMPAGEDAAILHGTRVLIVDDDAEGREVLSTVLRQYGAIVTAADNADDAFDKVQAELPALVLCDIGMPVIDGYQLLWRIRQHSQVPAIAVTAFARPEDRQRALSSGFSAHIPKPAAPAKTIATCVEVLKRAGDASPTA